MPWLGLTMERAQKGNTGTGKPLTDERRLLRGNIISLQAIKNANDGPKNAASEESQVGEQVASSHPSMEHRKPWHGAEGVEPPSSVAGK